MSSFGRRSVPGERSIREHANHELIHNRTIRAQIRDVNSENGYVYLEYEAMATVGTPATVPPLWLSFPPNAGAAWGRYMPHKTDIVKVAFDFNDMPRIVGYDVIATKESVASGQAGWPEIHDSHKKVAGKADADPKFAGFVAFKPLESGEYDFMSSGGAYILGGGDGRLHLAGGSVVVDLIKEDIRIDQKAQLNTILAENTEVRVGQVRRITADGSEKPIVGSESAKEFSVKLKQTSNGVAINTADLVVGDVMGDLATEQSSFSNDLRYLYRAYDSVIKVHEVMVDKKGNWEVSSTSATDGVKFDFQSGKWNTSFTEVLQKASAKHVIESNSIKLGADSVTEQAVLGNTYRDAEDTWFDAIETAISNLKTATTVFTTAMSAVGSAHMVPIYGPVTGSPMITAAMQAFNLAIQAISTALSAQKTVFQSKKSTYLSNTVKLK